MNIRPNDFVLEIGSGHNPKARSDVLCDKFIGDDEQRGGAIVPLPIVQWWKRMESSCRSQIGRLTMLSARMCWNTSKIRGDSSPN